MDLMPEKANGIIEPLLLVQELYFLYISIHNIGGPQ